MELNKEYDVAIVGGGLAGLTAAILIRRAGYSVVLFEKEKYPFHKVCGEYVSFESWKFLEQLGLPLSTMELPVIDHLLLTASNGKSFTTKLLPGGFGISRYHLDHSLAEIARQNGVKLLEETKVDTIEFEKEFEIGFISKMPGPKKVRAKTCLAAFGKRSNLDIKWKRNFLYGRDKRLNNYVGIKYHLKTDCERGVIGLHNFEDGYCGISKIEGDTYCLCYMTKSRQLKKCNNSIHQLEEQVLCINPHLKKIFEESHRLEGFPVVISQINFNKKEQVENHVLMLGDAAGMITPLCGNGMSIALHSGKIAAKQITSFLDGKISRQQMENAYTKTWAENFSARLQTGRLLQHFFGGKRTTNLFVQTLKHLPFLAKPLIKITHGKPF